MIYLDNSATTRLKPPVVINAVTTALKEYSANPGRSGHKLSVMTANVVSQTRERVASFFNCPDSDKVIFTKNCTESLNLAIDGTVKRGDHVVAIAFNHNSVLRPLARLQSQGVIELDIVEPDSNFAFTHSILKCIKPNTKLVCINHVCNVTGNTCDIYDIAQKIPPQVTLLVDCAQSAGYIDIDMSKLGNCMLAIACHKGLHATQGLGLLLLNEQANLDSALIYGGTGTQSEHLIQPLSYPEGFEAGTLNTPAIFGLNASLDFITENKQKHRAYLGLLQSSAFALLSKLGFIKIYSRPNHSGIITFDFCGYPSSKISDILSSEYAICVRGGLHCAPLVHKHLKTTEVGLVRISMGIDNTLSDITNLVSALNKINGRLH